jgi:hypothetical protein
MATLQERHIRALDKILGQEMKGTWYLRNELDAVYMNNDDITKLIAMVEPIYEKGRKLNGCRPYSPIYKFNRLVDAHTTLPKIVFQVLMPGSHIHQSVVVGEILLDVKLAEVGDVYFTLPEETPAVKLARENSWKASHEEIKALDALIAAAKELEKFGNRNFPVKVTVGVGGVQVIASYADPMKPVRAALSV